MPTMILVLVGNDLNLLKLDFVLFPLFTNNPRTIEEYFFEAIDLETARK